MDEEEFVKRYRLIQPLYANYVAQLSGLLRTLLAQAGIAYHVVEGRAKPVESFATKISRPGKKYDDPLSEVTDLAGLRIVLLYLDDVTPVINIVRQDFAVDEDRSVDKGAIVPPEQFGYQSVHLIVTLDDKRRLLPEWRTFSAMTAEIQIRTVLQHAWAAISHKLQYKNESEIPRRLKRRLYRLSGLLELADEEFLDLRKEQEELRSEIATAIDRQEPDVEIDRLSLIEYLNSSRAPRELALVAKKSGANIMPKNKSWVSDLLDVINHIGIRRIVDLDKVIRESLTWAEAVMDAFGELDGLGTMSVPFVVGLILIARYNNKLPKRIRAKAGEFTRYLPMTDKLIKR